MPEIPMWLEGFLCLIERMGWGWVWENSRVAIGIEVPFITV